MKRIYEIPEMLSTDMIEATIIAASRGGVTTGSKLGNEVVGKGTFYTKEDNGWDDFDEE